jgi:hypothetical protein
MNGSEGAIEVVRGRMSPEVGEELVEFWTARGALTAASARERLNEVVCVLRDPEGAIAGVNSVYAGRVETVGGRRVWIYRSFIDPARGDAWPAMVDAAFAALGAEFTGRPEEPIGLCVPLRERSETARRPEAVWPGTSFIYAGRAPGGAQLHVAYFEGALIGPGYNGSMEDPSLEPGYRVELFEEQDEVSEQDIIDLWARESAVPAEEARRRVLEVLFVGIHERDGLVGIASAYLQRSPQLDLQLWYYRAFVASAHRMGNVAVQLALQGRDLLQERYVSGEDRRGCGVLYEVENEGLKTYFNQALWWPTLLTFIGETASGAHVRVRYFPGATVPDPSSAANPRS